MPDLGDVQARLRAAREARDEARASVRQDAFALRDLDAAIASAERHGGDDRQGELAALRRRREEAARRLDAGRAALGQARDRERGIAGELLQLDPGRLVAQLDDRVPFLLLPVRLETKFAGTAEAPELWLRVFPDDVAVSMHERALTVGEVAAGQTYWKARTDANGQPTAAARADAHRAAWNVLAGRHEAYRAGWIARATRPRNWSDAVTDPAVLDFQPVDTKPASWTEAPRSLVLPDRFVAILVSGAQQQSFVGGLIPDDLLLGPDPLQAEGFLTRDAAGRISVDDDLRWLIDFDRAVTLGMAMRIPLAPPFNAGSIETLVVLGVRASTAAADGPPLLARLIENHRFSRGLSLVAQGTPTNNTEDAPAGFTTSSATTIDETFGPEQAPDALTHVADPFAQLDGERLAAALGLPLEAVGQLPNATLADVAEAMAMNRALWPATLGGFLRDMMKPLLTDATIELTKAFFTRFVAGRGLLPALRVGNQPYGILTTSSLARWQWSPAELGDAGPFWAGLLDDLVRLDGAWHGLLPQVSVVGRPDTPLAHLVSVVGLQASSVGFYTRTAVSDDYLWNYIRLKNTPQAYATDVWEALQSQRGLALGRLPFDFLAPYPLKRLTFWRQHDLLTGPVVDGDPVVPLSESAPVRPYDGTHNYIDWLTTGSRAQLESQTFLGADGKPVAAPTALLYLMLRQGYLAELGHGGVTFAKVRVPAVFAELPDEPPIANVGANRTLLQSDVLNLDTAKIGVTARSGTVADYLLANARAVGPAFAKPPEAIPLADMTAALTRLAGLPTARLERAFAEHVDLCSYRLDAWVQGLFARRLDALRESRQEGGGGVYVGAFGWVENLAPNTANRRPVALQDLDPALSRDLVGPVVEYTNGGGYVHAPSLAHAVTAAVLRNAYLSHADPATASTMTVNLTSSRVRTALAYLDGLRNGQELAALLGYQLERGLHEGHPGVELDEFIYVLRERFPLTSKKLTPVPDGQAAEVIEARNVVDGYDLLEFVRGKTYPYGIAGLPADAARSGAIAAEIDRLADAVDALADLLLAEGVHQAVQGNYDRARGVLQSVTEGQAPPDLEVAATPRSGRALTHRVALSLDPAQTAGWSAALTPRAAASAPLNHWLTTVLPAPAAIQWKVTRGLDAPQFVALPTLALEPLDVVLMSGDVLGNAGGELEQFLADHYRRSQAVPDAMRTFFGAKTDPDVPDAQALVFDLAAAGPGGVALASLGPLLKALRRLVSVSRPLHANDFVRPAEAQTIAPGDPKGYGDIAELKTRVETAYTTLKTAADALAAYLSGTVQPLADALDADHVVVPAWAGVLAALGDQLVALGRAGVPEALPRGLDVTEPVIDALVLQARTVAALVTTRLADARALLDDPVFVDPLPPEPAKAASRIDQRFDRCTEAAKLVLGRGFVAVPQYTLHAAGLPELAAAPLAVDRLVVEEWLQPLTRVRPPMEAFGWVLTYHDWLQPTPLALVPLQLPVHPGDAWIGTAFGAKLVDDSVLSVTVANPTGLAGPQCGLLVDEWTELVPTARETTGLAFHANRPNAQPPQALLLAVAPRLQGAWSWDDLLAIVLETLQRAKLRAVEPDMVATTDYFQLLPTILTEFTRAFAATHLAQNVAEKLRTP
jgi:hypothetical protein